MSAFAIFKWVKTIRSKSGRLHFRRFAIFQTPWLSIYIHRIHDADRDPHLHSHPWPFWTMVLHGSYMELTESGMNWRKPWDAKSGDYNYFHKIHSITKGPVTTILIAGCRRKEWYYKVDGELVMFDQYHAK